MKKILEVIVCFFHPVAVVLVWADLLRRKDMISTTKLIWALTSLIPFVPVLYVLFSGDLW